MKKCLKSTWLLGDMESMPRRIARDRKSRLGIRFPCVCSLWREALEEKKVVCYEWMSYRNQLPFFRVECTKTCVQVCVTSMYNESIHVNIGVDRDRESAKREILRTF